MILIPLTLSVLFCHRQSEICRAERKVCLFGLVSSFFLVGGCLFVFFLPCFCASLSCLSLLGGFVFVVVAAFIFIFFLSFSSCVVSFISRAILARFAARFHFCITPPSHPQHSPSKHTPHSPRRQTYSHSHVSLNWHTHTHTPAFTL